jgi:hypothetical protein
VGAKEVLVIIQLWLKHRPIRTWRNRRRAKKGLPPVEGNVNTESVWGIVRHILTTVGGALVTNGYVTDAQLETLVGAVVVLAGVTWSVIQKKRAE